MEPVRHMAPWENLQSQNVHLETLNVLIIVATDYLHMHSDLVGMRLDLVFDNIVELCRICRCIKPHVIDLRFSRFSYMMIFL